MHCFDDKEDVKEVRGHKSHNTAIQRKDMMLPPGPKVDISPLKKLGYIFFHLF